MARPYAGAAALTPSLFCARRSLSTVLLSLLTVHHAECFAAPKALPSLVFQPPLRSTSTTTQRRTRRINSSSSLSMSISGRHMPRRDIQLPLLDATTGVAKSEKWNVPLPHSHLPAELSTASLYEMELSVPIHKLLAKEAISARDGMGSGDYGDEEGRCYGHVVWKSDGDDSSLVGAVGCAGEIMIAASKSEAASLMGQMVDPSVGDDDGPMLVLARGSYRFRVKEVVRSIPYPVAIVDELLDDDVDDIISIDEKLEDDDDDDEDDDEDDDDDDDDIYATLPSDELVPRVLETLGSIIRTKLDADSKPLSPLERSIIETASPMAAATRQSDAEERVAVYEIFVSSLVDLVPDKRDRRYAVAMMAGELAGLSPDDRTQMLATTDGASRLRFVLRKLSSLASMDAAKKMTGKLSGADDESKKDLRVGEPTLPSWVNQIRKGVRIEYFWSEEEGWCVGTVVDDPVRVVNEMLVLVKFEDDGSTHRLPFRGDEKARWRPPQD